MAYTFNPFSGNLDYFQPSTSPASPDTSVQFNDGGVFGGDSNFVWIKSSDSMGIQVASPLVPAHIASITGTTINNVVTGSAVLTAESLPSAPSGTANEIQSPAAGAGGSITFVDGGSGTALTANGTNYYFRVYPVLVAGSVYYKSQNYEQLGPTMDPNDSLTYNIQPSWGVVTIPGETVNYAVEYSTDGTNYTFLSKESGTSKTYDSLSSGSDDTTAWPTFYKSDTAPTAFTGGSAQYINGGAGGISQVFGTVLMEVDSTKTINGTIYVSGTPTSGSFDDSGAGGNYDAEMSWTDNGNATDAIVRISQDSGSTWYYQFAGTSTSPYVFTSLSNDSAAEARWGQTFGGSENFAFAPYGKGLSPSNNTIYSSVGTTYSVSVVSTYGSVLKHTYTGMPAGGGKILAPQSAPAYGLDVTGTFYDAGYTSWGSGTTVTPNSYGFTGTNQNRDYRVYGYNSTLGIYSATPLTLSTVSGSGSKYVALSWTLPSGITTVKITRQVNGGGYTVSKNVTGSSTTDDSTDTTWSGNTTVTPTTVIPGGVRIDRDNTAVTDQPHLMIVATSSGTRYPKISFGTATDSTAEPSFQSHIYGESNTGYLNLSSSRVQVVPNLGSTPTVLMGNTNVFNNTNSSTIHFNVKGQTDSGLINTRSDYDTVFFGQTGASDPTATIRVQPARSSDTALILAGHSSMTSTTVLFRTQDSVGSLGAEITVGGHIWGAQGSDANPGISFRADQDCGLRNVTTNTVSMVTGGTERTRWTSTGFSIGTGTGATARLTIAAGGTGANTAPIKLTSGSLNTTPEVGAIEFLTDKWYATITTGAARKELTLNDIALTSGRVPIVTTNGRLTDDSDLTFSGDTLTATKFAGALNGTVGATTPSSGVFTSLQADTITNDTGLAAGTYTPTLTGVANVSSTTSRQATYMRVGNTVTVAGQFDLTPTGVGLVSVGISLPVASNFSTAYQAGGVGHVTGASTGHGGLIEADATNDRVQLDYYDAVGSADTVGYTFTYEVI